MQNHYNLLYREEEREMLPLCADQGVGVIPWSPLARGRLTRDWNATAARSQTDMWGDLYQETDRVIVERVAEVAEKRGVPRAQVALAWLLSNPTVTAPIVGVTKVGHLDDAVAARRPGTRRHRARPARGALPAAHHRTLPSRRAPLTRAGPSLCRPRTDHPP
jgi:aryl-alcohol dehydrogenase-like predicted oxidoreductase